LPKKKDISVYVKIVRSLVTSSIYLKITIDYQFNKMYLS